MTLSPDDVRSKQFSLARKGYRESEVDEFLDVVIDAIETRDATIATLKASANPETHTREGGLPFVSEAATRLLSMAETTAAQYTADAAAQAAETLNAAELRACEITSAAEATASRVLQDADAEHRRVMGNLHYEQNRLQEAMNEIRAMDTEARSDLEDYLRGLLAKVQDRSGPRGIRALSA